MKVKACGWFAYNSYTYIFYNLYIFLKNTFLVAKVWHFETPLLDAKNIYYV